MGYKPIKILVYGMFPTYFVPVIEGAYKALSVDIISKEQEREYPEWMREQQHNLLNIIEKIAHYAWLVKIEIISADSLRGVLLAIRYRLSYEPAIIVEGRVFKGAELSADYIVGYITTLLKKRFQSVSYRKT